MRLRGRHLTAKPKKVSLAISVKDNRKNGRIVPCGVQKGKKFHILSKKITIVYGGNFLSAYLNYT